MTRSFWERFAAKLESAHEAPSPLREAMIQEIKPGDSLHLLVFGPAGKIMHQKSSATLLAILDHEWILVSASDEAETPFIGRCHFSDTLFLTFTTVLLYGRLEIDFAAGGRAQHVTIEFNTVMDDLYLQVLRRILEGMDNVSGIASFENEPTKKIDLPQKLPLRFRSAVRRAVPPGQQVRQLLYWPVVYNSRRGLFRRELLPAAAFALTDRELLLDSDEKTQTRLRSAESQKYGTVATHCPLSRIHLGRMLRAFHDRLADHIKSGLGVALAPHEISLEVNEPSAPAVDVGYVDAALSSISFFVPMRLFRGPVEQALLRKSRWEVRKNLSRLAADWCNRVADAIKDMTRRAELQAVDELDILEQTLAQKPSDMPRLHQVITDLESCAPAAIMSCNNTTTERTVSLSESRGRPQASLQPEVEL